MTYNGLGPSSAAAEDGARGDQLEGVISHQDNAPHAANQAQLISHIQAHIKQGEKAQERANQAKDKAQQHFVAAGQYLALLKANHSSSWREWKALLATKVGLSTGRASELMQIADGRKTVEQVRADTNRRKLELRSRNEDDDQPPIETNETKINELIRRAERARLGARFDGVPNQEAIEAARRAGEAWNGLVAALAPKNGKSPTLKFVKDDGGRKASKVFRGANRKDETGDCVTRAITIATGKSYDEVHDALTVASVRAVHAGNDSWKNRAGVKMFDPDHGCGREAYRPYLESLGWKFTKTSGREVHLQASDLPGGRLVVETRRHLVAVIDHVVHDTFDSRNRTVWVRGEGLYEQRPVRRPVAVQGYWRAAS
jgi:hypothetical protein